MFTCLLRAVTEEEEYLWRGGRSKPHACCYFLSVDGCDGANKLLRSQLDGVGFQLDGVGFRNSARLPTCLMFP